MTRIRQSLLVFAALLLLLAFDQWAFQAFGGDYLQWYLDNGSLIGLVTAVFAMAWGELDKNVGLISPHPRAYVAACLRLVSLSSQVLFGQSAAIFQRLAEIFDELHQRSRRWEVKDCWLALDGMLAWSFALLFMSLLILWLIVVAPMQYFVFLLCGSLPRLLRATPVRYIARLESSGMEVKKIQEGETIPDGWWDASFGTKPVALTGLFSSLFLLLLDTVIENQSVFEILFEALTWPWKAV